MSLIYLLILWIGSLIYLIYSYYRIEDIHRQFKIKLQEIADRHSAKLKKSYDDYVEFLENLKKKTK